MLYDAINYIIKVQKQKQLIFLRCGKSFILLQVLPKISFFPFMPVVLYQIHEVSGSDCGFEYYLKNSKNWKFHEWLPLVTVLAHSEIEHESCGLLRIACFTTY